MSEWEIVLRMILALFFGTLIGIEREWRHKTAGLKTNALVAVGASIFGLISEHGFSPGSNTAQVAAGVVTGIGFIGGGVIMRQGASVQGINSAATLWVTAGAGLAIGLGFQKLTWVILPLVLFAQLILPRIAEWIDQRSGLVTASLIHHLSVCYEPRAGDNVRALWEAFAAQKGIEVVSFEESKQEPSGTIFQIACHLSPAAEQKLSVLNRNFSETPGVNQIKWSKARSDG